jgi:hypothetical protein
MPIKKPHWGALAVLQIMAAFSQLLAADPVRNLFNIDSMYFDTASHRICLSWNIDTADIPVGTEGSITIACGTILPGSPNGAFPLATLKGDSSLAIPSLRFDTVYSLGIWFRENGQWIPPDTFSIATLMIPPATWEPVTLFSPDDTVRVLGNRVLLWHDADYGVNVPLHIDTVRLRSLPRGLFSGFIEAGPCVYFTNPVPTPPMFIALQCDSVPASALSKVRIFRDSCGLMLLERGCTVDTVNRRVLVKTTRFNHPFVPLIDTMRPQIDFISDTGAVIDATEPDLAFRLSDNSANAIFRVFCGSGDKSLFTGAPYFSEVLDDTTARFVGQLPVEGIRETGLRAYITLSDACFDDTINVSRQAIRLRCDELSTSAGTIMPIAATAVLDSLGARYCLRKLFEETNGVYDKKELRLYRWFPAAINESSDGWIEYSDRNDTLFTFIPGRLFWLITRKESVIDFGRGLTPSLKDTLILSLASGQWTDFSMPYGFGIGLDDILDATGPDGDSLSLYQWVQDIDRSTFTARAVYCPGVPSLDTSSIMLPGGNKGIYTIYNPLHSDVCLRIPPCPAVFPASENRAPLFRTRAHEEWCFRIDIAGGGKKGSSVYCAASTVAHAPRLVPPPPSFPGPGVRVRPMGGSGSYGIAVLPLLNDSAAVFELSVSNPCPINTAVSLTSNRLSGMVDGTFIINGTTHASDRSLTINLDAHSTVPLLFVAGTSRQIDYFAKSAGSSGSGIIAITRHPFCNSLVVSFSPAAAAQRYLLELFDLRGKIITAARHAGGAMQPLNLTIRLKEGMHGCYIVKVTAFTDKRRAVSGVRKTMVF